METDTAAPRPKSGKQTLLPEVEVYLHLLLLLYLIDKKTYDVVSLLFVVLDHYILIKMLPLGVFFLLFFFLWISYTGGILLTYQLIWY